MATATQTSPGWVRLIDGAALLGVTLATIVLVITSIPTWWGDGLIGNRLMGHMMASGLLIFALPALALTRLPRLVAPRRSARAWRWAFWAMIIAGIVTIGTMFLSMLPIASTDRLHTLAWLHGWSGYALAALLAASLVLGGRRVLS